MNRISLVLGVALAMTLAGSASAQVSTDLWDVSQGTVVTNSSGGTPSNMFGGMEINFGSGAIEPGIAFFDDGGRTAGFVHFVEFQTPQPIRLTGYHLLAGDDDANNPGDRGFTQFRLYAFNGAAFQLIDTFTPASNPYPNNSVDVTKDLAPVDAQRFRAEFVQFASDSGPGPRVSELDAVGTALPEPMSAGVCGIAVILLRCRRRG